MRFGEVRVDEAEGLILAHSLRLPGAMLKKGRVLTTDDVRALKAAGVNFVTGARLDPSDVDENEAARMVAGALAGDGIAIGPAFGGRCTLFASVRGVVAIDRDRLDRLNLVDEAVTVATVPPFEIVGPRQMVATVKIIPFGVDARVVETCAAFASKGGPLVTVKPFRPLKAGLILTTLPGIRERVIEEAAAVTRARVAALGGAIDHEIRCPHDTGAIERAIAKLLAAGCDSILVIGATATVDRRDVVPSAIQKAGGTIEHFGMPVDPGNLLLLASIGAVPVVNLPGCGRSPKPNGLDWVLRRLAADIPLRAQDLMRMGAGGLLKEQALRPAQASVETGFVSGLPRAAALILADGDVGALGKVMVARAVEAALSAGFEPLVVVAGANADLVEEMLPACEVRLVRNAPEGPLAAGLACLPADVDAALVLDATRPGARTAHLAEVAKAFDPDEGRAIVVTVHRGERGGPMLVARDYFGGLAEAARADSLLADHAEMVFELVIDDEPEG
ncbi:MAG: NTP transferase domain-containing protein [Solirubrobacterales bacterium]